MEDNFIDNDSLVYEDDFEKDINFEEEEVEKPSQEQQNDGEDFVTKLLRSRGISDKKIQFENEYGELEEVDFDSLSEAEKFEILNSDDSPILDEELKDLNQLRQMRMTLTEYTEYLKDQAIKEYLAQNSTPKYEVDNLNDEEVFVYDLMQRYGEDLTNEEIDSELNRAKENEELFNKQVGLIRNRLKKAEDDQKALAEKQEQEQKTADFNEFVDSVIAAAQDTKELQGVELDDEDRQNVIDFLLQENPQGKTGFYDLLSDPKQVFKLGWYALYGDQAFNSTIDYFKKELAKSRRNDKPKTSKVVNRSVTKESDPYGLDDSIFK